MDRAAGWIIPQALLLFAGCMGTQSGTESTQPPAECRVVEETALTPTADTEFGTPEDVAAEFAGPMSAPLRWSRHDDQGAMETHVDVGLTAMETATYFEREGECGNALVFEATLSFATRDGAFAEQVLGTFELDALGHRFVGQIPLEALAGSYDAPLVERWYHEPILTFNARFSPLLGQLDMAEGDETREFDDGTVVVAASVASWNADWP